MKHNKYMGAGICLAALLAASVIGCGDAGNVQAETTAAAEPAESTAAALETEADTRVYPTLPEANFGGYDFRIMTKGSFNAHWTAMDIFAEATNGDPINDAVYNRNTAVMDRYNFKITEITDFENISGAVGKAVKAGDDAYDMVSAGMNGGVEQMIQGQYLLDLHEVPNLDLSKPWYDQNANKELSVGGKLYATAGDLLIMDDDATWSVLFNKEMATRYDLPDLYEAVENGTWVIDDMLTYCTTVASDINGDGKMDENDQWGNICENYNLYAYIVGCGLRVVDKDENDLPYYNVETEAFFNAFEKGHAINGNFDLVLSTAGVPALATMPSQGRLNACDLMFTSGKVLFYTTGLNRVTLFREMETDFGILPMPKYDAAQEGYHHPISLWCSNSITVPTTASDPARTGHIIEALSAESKYTLTPAYYERTLKTKASRDEESAAILDIIFATRVFDLGNMYNWGGMFDAICGLTLTTDPNLTSTIEKKEKAADKALQKFLESIGE